MVFTILDINDEKEGLLRRSEVEYARAKDINYVGLEFKIGGSAMPSLGKIENIHRKIDEILAAGNTVDLLAVDVALGSERPHYGKREEMDAVKLGEFSAFTAIKYLKLKNCELPKIVFYSRDIHRFIPFEALFPNEEEWEIKYVRENSTKHHTEIYKAFVEQVLIEKKPLNSFEMGKFFMDDQMFLKKVGFDEIVNPKQEDRSDGLCIVEINYGYGEFAIQWDEKDKLRTLKNKNIEYIHSTGNLLNQLPDLIDEKVSAGKRIDVIAIDPMLLSNRVEYAVDGGEIMVTSGEYRALEIIKMLREKGEEQLPKFIFYSGDINRFKLAGEEFIEKFGKDKELPFEIAYVMDNSIKEVDDHYINFVQRGLVEGTFGKNNKSYKLFVENFPKEMELLENPTVREFTILEINDSKNDLILNVEEELEEELIDSRLEKLKISNIFYLNSDTRKDSIFETLDAIIGGGKTLDVVAIDQDRMNDSSHYKMSNGLSVNAYPGERIAFYIIKHLKQKGVEDLPKFIIYSGDVDIRAFKGIDWSINNGVKIDPEIKYVVQNTIHAQTDKYYEFLQHGLVERLSFKTIGHKIYEFFCNDPVLSQKLDLNQLLKNHPDNTINLLSFDNDNIEPDRIIKNLDMKYLEFQLYGLRAFDEEYVPKFMKSAGLPINGALHFHSDSPDRKADENNILVIERFNLERDMPIIKNFQGLVCLNPEYPGHLQEICLRHNISAIICPKDEYILDRENETLKIGERIFKQGENVSIGKDLEENVIICKDGDVGQGYKYNLVEDAYRCSRNIINSFNTLSLEAEIGLNKELKKGFENGFKNVGIYKTEFMFTENEQAADIFRTLILSGQDDPARTAAVDESKNIHKKNYTELFTLAKNANSEGITIRLLDVKAEEFLNEQEFDSLCQKIGKEKTRGVQFGLAFSDIYKSQLQAIFQSVKETGFEGEVRISIPMIKTENEMQQMASMIKSTERMATGSNNAKIYPMIENQEAAENLKGIMKHSHGILIGGNDLSCDILGLSRTKFSSIIDYILRENEDPLNNLTGKVKEVIKNIISIAKESYPDQKVVFAGNQGYWNERTINFLHKAGCDSVCIPAYKENLIYATISAAKAHLNYPREELVELKKSAFGR